MIVECGPPKQFVQQSIPVVNQLQTARFQHRSDLYRQPVAFDHRLKVSEQMGQVELMTMVVQIAVGYSAYLYRIDPPANGISAK